MFYKTTIIVLIYSALLSGCSFLQPKNAETVNLLAQSNDYDKAIATYNQLKINEQSLVNIKQLNKSRKQYEANLLKQITSLSKKNHFIKAKKQYDEGIIKIPSSNPLLKAGSKLETQQQDFLKYNQYRYDIIRARFLIEEKAQLEKILPGIDTDSKFLTLYNQRPPELTSLSEKLGLLGLEKVTKNQSKTATKLLTLAEALKSDARWKDALSKLDSKKKQLTRRKQQKKLKEEQLKKNQLQKKNHSIKDKFENAMALGNLPAAQQALSNYSKHNTADKEWPTTAKKRLNRTIQTSLEIALKKGQILYSQGEINKALKVWRTAQRYVPNDKKLNDSIKRAATFQKNLLNLTAPAE